MASTSLSRCFAIFRRSFCLFFWRLRVAGFLLFPILPALRPSYLSDLKHRAPKGPESTAKWTVNPPPTPRRIASPSTTTSACRTKSADGRQPCLRTSAKRSGGLLRDYGPHAMHPLDDILSFHVAFERSHPFQDGNGRVGRLIMFKECLAGIEAPFIITGDMKAFYHRSLAEWDRGKGFVTETCLAAQDRFKSTLDYFRIAY